MSFQKLFPKVPDSFIKEAKEQETKNFNKYIVSFPDLKETMLELSETDMTSEKAEQLVQQYNAGKKLNGMYQKDYLRLKNDIRLKIYSMGKEVILAIDNMI